MQKDARNGALAYSRADKILWGIRHLNGLATLVRIEPPYTAWQQVHTFQYGEIPYDLDVSPDGRTLAFSFGEVNGHQSVRLVDVAGLMKGVTTPLAEFDFGSASVPNNFVFSPDGRYLYGSSYYSGVSNIYRYDIQSRKVDAVTNTDTGFFRPIPLGGDELTVFRYTGRGFVPTRVTAKPLEDVAAITFLGTKTVEDHPVLKDWNTATVTPVPYDKLEKRVTDYHLAGGLLLESMYPIVQGYKNTQAAGFRVNFSDPLELNRVTLAASYSPVETLANSERVHLFASYERYDWKLKASLNNADFYDLFGPTKLGRKGYSVRLEHKTVLLYDEPRRVDLTVGGSYMGNLDRLPAYQNVAVAVTRMGSFDAKLNFTNVRGSMGKVDEEKGQTGTLAMEVDRVDGRNVLGTYGTFDVGVPLPVPHSSIWLRSAAGFSPNDANNLFANFYFGAFGNNWVDSRTEKRYREFYSFPGLGLDEVGGRNFVKTMVELNLPPWRFAHAGSPGAYLTWMRPAMFVGGLATNIDAPVIRRTAADVGGQLDFRFTVLSDLDMTLSVGGAVAFRKGHAPSREAMVSLKVLR